MNNDVAQILSILDKIGHIMVTTTINLAYRSIVSTIVGRSMNGFSSRKTHTSDVDVFKGIPAKDIEFFALRQKC